MPGKPEEPGPNPQSCDTDCSQSREWDHQGCLGHFQGGQGGHFQVLGAQEGERIHHDVTTHHATSNRITIHLATLVRTLKMERDVCETSQSVMIGS